MVLILWALRLYESVSSFSIYSVAVVILGISGLIVIVSSFANWEDEKKAFQTIGYFVLGLFIVSFFMWSFFQVFQIPNYGTDELAFDQYAAILAHHGQNPYITSMAPAFNLFRVAPNSYTFLLNGSKVVHLSYPSLAFEIYEPLLAFGLNFQAGTMLNVAFWAISIAVMFFLLPQKFRALTVLIGSLSVYIAYAVGGVTDALFLPFLLIASYKWDRFDPHLRKYKTWVGPIGLGLAMAIKQNSWAIFIFLLIAFYAEERFTSGNLKLGIRKTIIYATITVSTFLLPNLPYIFDSPLAWFKGMLTPVLSHAIPSGQGFVGLTIFAGLGGGSLQLYTLCEVLVFVCACMSVFFAYPTVKKLIFIMPSFILFFASRSFGSYLVTLIPVAVVSAITVRNVVVEKKENHWRLVLGVSLILITLSGAFAITDSSPIALSVVKIHTTGELQTIDQITVAIANKESYKVHPYFSMEIAGTTTAFWNVASSNGPVTLSPNQSTVITLQAPNFYAMPGLGGGFQVVAYTDSPATVSVSPVFQPPRIHVGIYPDSFDRLLPVNQNVTVTVQLLDQFERPVATSGVTIYLSQIEYDQFGLIPGNAIITSKFDNFKHLSGASPVFALTNSKGSATFTISGTKINQDPVYFEANLVDPSQDYPYGFSEIVPIRFTVAKQPKP